MAAFEHGLRDRGYVPGEDVIIDIRSAEGEIGRYPQVVRDIVQSQPDVILTAVNANTSAVKAVTQTIPIVMVLGTDVISAGYVKSLAAPGSNITGLSVDVGADVVAKRFQLFRELAPTVSRVAILSEPPSRIDYRRKLESVVSAASLKMLWLEYSGDLQRDYAELLRWQADGIIHLPQARMYGRRREIVVLEATHKLASSFTTSEFVEAGGLTAYGPNLSAQYKSAATYVAKILRGANPADLPVEQPTKFDLAINLKTAKMLGLSVPQSLLLRAERIIE